MNRRKSAALAGFTYIEILLSLGIMGMLMVAMGVLMLTGHRVYAVADSSLAAHEQVSKAFNEISKELEVAHSIAIGNEMCASCAISFQLPVDMLNNTVEWGAVDKNGQGQANWFVQYRLVILPSGNRQLIRVLRNNNLDVPGENIRVIANEVDSQIDNIFVQAQGSLKVRLKVSIPVSSYGAAGNISTQLHFMEVALRNIS